MRSSTDLCDPPFSWDTLKEDQDPNSWRAQWQYYERELAASGYRLEWPDFESHENATKIRTDLPLPDNPFIPQAHEAYVACAMKEFEDWIVTMGHPFVRTATDPIGRFVLIKAVFNSSDECALLRFLRDHRAQHADPTDHTIPIFDLIDIGFMTFIVMAQWADAWPRFYTLGEFIECFRQCLEGLNFLHSNLIAHGVRDIHPENILLNHSGGYPQDDEPVPFRSLFKCCYAYIDFGLSVYLLPGSDIASCTVTSDIAGMHTPEHSATVPHNPFYSDIYQLGAVFEDALEHDAKTTTLAELIGTHAPGVYDLVYAMMADVPSERLSAGDALQWLLEIRDDVPGDILETAVSALPPRASDAEIAQDNFDNRDGEEETEPSPATNGMLGNEGSEPEQ
ncbi:hypothetical protein AURDEDRAFT_175347 [Auricularia subglabra TFB-10046 SS5]|uniref:Protein kinase domain-containing protein n=1 Tax=Auricularia subglabra (strain TFB-10046 / SS5) TaxID=717982 RepID=J0D8G7_AURST|nr:hypothetical protein AURDEDRAFT_175347 [Auricularia subglabra TFB-10046 SS5]